MEYLSLQVWVQLALKKQNKLHLSDRYSNKASMIHDTSSLIHQLGTPKNHLFQEPIDDRSNYLMNDP